MNPTTTPVPAAIVWRCSTCGADTSDGAIHIDLQKVRAAERSLADWESRPRERAGRAFDLADVFSMPTVESWQVSCAACRHDCCGCYSIEVARCRSMAALIQWTAHLYDKNWFAATNWVAFMHRVVQENGSLSEAGVW